MKSCNRVVFAVLLLFAIHVTVGCESADGPVGLASEHLTSGTVIPSGTGFGDQGVIGQPATNPDVGGALGVSWCCTTWYVPIPTNVGDAVSGVSAAVKDNATVSGSTGNNVILALITQTTNGSGGVTTTVLGSAGSSGTGATRTLAVQLAAPHTMVAGESLLVESVALTGGALPGPAVRSSWIGSVTITAPAAPAAAIIARPISGLTARAMADVPATATMTLGRWSFVGTGWMIYALPVRPGEMIKGFNWWASKRNAATDIHAELFAMDAITTTLTTIGHDVFSHAQTGNIALSASGLSISASVRTTYFLGVQEGSNPDGTTAFSDAEVLVQ